MSAGKRGPVIRRRRYPVAGSCHSSASAVRCTPVARWLELLGEVIEEAGRRGVRAL
ncbi:hypothetical protein [Actinacidiphila glaucinigra]|uniref:hypothetical protein n=1 Tax=Actinacidiphila glaucinigra TaxID=235986 RepID=UPI00371A1DB3